MVVSNSLDESILSRAAEWETTLRAYLQNLQAISEEQYGLTIRFSTGVSLEEEINKSTNMDVKIVVLSYLMMFFYISLTLGQNVGSSGDESLSGSFKNWIQGIRHRLSRQSSSNTLSEHLGGGQRASILPQISRSPFVNSKFLLGLFGIALVIVSVLSSVAIFSLLGVKVTLIIAEVIPFLVLAVGVDNIFILVHELDKQNLQFGPNAASGLGSATPTVFSPTIRPSGYSGDVGDNAATPLQLSAVERVARSLAKMGPSILLSSLTETVAFGLGALVPMPAVRNFALYAAGSVFINAVLQVTAFVSAMTLDLRRVEVS
jgi:Niemann-Pick C1 protein